MIDGRGAAMNMAFECICSESAARELTEQERKDLIRRAVDMAVKLDTAQAAGDVFSVDLDGREWKVIISVGRRWAKILSREELAEAIGKQ
jgi:hypothetical protein